ncbi:hypothetical protein BC938DRAFT_484217 [Jimgerdemannia flammicorona]|uniref:Uncharacterized protein n=1 Tax=Jimgerdemannia flammicorona TaxID=994334 RepID=A0A433QAA2_9FUNG|nr:hypothetical protein BC938DRAFT_484217 [Jimgerdemannia flammicorona]
MPSSCQSISEHMLSSDITAHRGILTRPKSSSPLAEEASHALQKTLKMNVVSAVQEPLDPESPEALRKQIQQSSDTIYYLTEKLDYLMTELQKNAVLVASLERALLSKDAQLEHFKSHIPVFDSSKLPVAGSKPRSLGNSSVIARQRLSTGAELPVSRLRRFGRSRAASSASLTTPHLAESHAAKTEHRASSAAAHSNTLSVPSSERPFTLPTDPTHEDTIHMMDKIDEASQSASSLRSILAFKTTELNELVAQLHLAYEALESVEKLAEGFEMTLAGSGLDAENPRADSAVRKASPNVHHLEAATKVQHIETLPRNREHHDTKIPKTTEAPRLHERHIKQLIAQLEKSIDDIGLDRAAYMKKLGNTDDPRTIGRALDHLKIAKTVRTSSANNLKRRTTLLNGLRRDKDLGEINTLGKKIREALPLWKEYTYGFPLMIGGVDIIVHLDNQDDASNRNVSMLNIALASTTEHRCNTYPFGNHHSHLQLPISEKLKLTIPTENRVVAVAPPTPSPTISSRIPRPSSSKSTPTRRTSLNGSTSVLTAHPKKVTSAPRRLSVTTHTTRRAIDRSYATDPMAARPMMSPTKATHSITSPAVPVKTVVRRKSDAQFVEKGIPMPRINVSKKVARAVAGRG